jgi:hypothetical protein
MPTAPRRGLLALGVARPLRRCQDEPPPTSSPSRTSFVAGAELATAPEAADRLEDGVSRITAEMTDALDAEIDKYMARVDLPPKFVIPGGNQIWPSSTSAAPSCAGRAKVVRQQAGESLDRDHALPEPCLTSFRYL